MREGARRRRTDPCDRYAPIVALADDFARVLDGLADDWTDLTMDLRIADEDRYREAALFMAQCNAQPYSKADWHWRIRTAAKFGHAAAPESVRWSLGMLDRAEIDGTLSLREHLVGRAEYEGDSMWGRPESVRREFRIRRGLE